MEEFTSPFPKTSIAAICALLLLCLAGCNREEKQTARDEEHEPAQAGVLHISEAVQKQIGLETQSAIRREVLDTLTVTGWLEAEPGREVTVKAPIAGFVTASTLEPLPRLGQMLERGERLVSLQVFLSPQDIAQLVNSKEDVDIAVEQARISMKLAQDQLERVNAARDAVAGTRLAELKEIFERSKAAYNESRDKLPFLLQEPYDGLALVKPVRVDSPMAGHVVAMHAVRDQFVIAGDPLWTISDWSTLWLRVPVFETDLSRVTRDGIAHIVLPGTLETASAKPVRLLQPTKPGYRTVELLYEVSNPDLALRVGQAVTAELPTGKPVERLLVARSALLWDGLGNSWVFVKTGADSFRRQKIETGGVVDNQIAVTRGLEEDDEVVVVGAEILFGEEFKSAIQADDDG